MEFIAEPPFSGFISPSLPEESKDAMQQEVDGLLSNHAIELVPEYQKRNGFYAGYFVVDKRDGGKRPILKLKKLNCFMQYQRFKVFIPCLNRSQGRILTCANLSTTLEVQYTLVELNTLLSNVASV